MALISSESITLIVNGTLQSEFFTIFWPTRFTYSTITGSVIKRVLFSISSAYCLPILISPSVEYQLPRPRLPISRLPTALTSSMLPDFTFCISLPGSTTLSGSTFTLQSPPTAVPGAGVWSFAFFLLALELSSGAVQAVVMLGSPDAEPLSPDFDGNGASPPTGVLPGAGCAAGAPGRVEVG